MTHNATVETVGGHTHRAVCGCGWHGAWLATEKAAAHDGRHHVEQASTCRKERFASLAEARMALVNAEIARSLHGSSRRRERRAYFCEACHAWHLTSRVERVSA